MTDTGTTDFFQDLERRRQAREAMPDFGPAAPITDKPDDLDAITNDTTRSYADRLAARRQLMEQGTIEPDPGTSDLERRGAYLSGVVGQESLAEPGMQDFLLRADLALSDTFEEQHLKFMDKFPEGDFVFVPRVPETVTGVGRGPTILFRRTASEEYAELDAMAMHGIELYGDIADVAGEAPGIALETVAAIVTRGSGTFVQLAAMFGGNVAGELLKEGVEELRDYQLESATTIGMRAVTEAGWAVASAGITDLAMRGPLNYARGAAVIRLRPGATAAQVSAARLGIDPLLPTQVANSPIIRKIGNQVAGTTQSVNDYVVRQNNQAVSALVRLRREDLARVFAEDPQNLIDLHETAIDQIVPVVQRGTPSLSLGGTAIGQGIVEYDELASTLVNKAYSDARRVATPEFDIHPTQAVADEVLAGTRVASPGADITQADQLMRADPIDPKVRSIAEQIRDADPTLPTTMAGTPAEADSVMQLRAWRSQLWDLKTPNPGEIFRQTHRAAQRLFSAVDRALKTPANADPRFLTAWTRANDIAHARFDTLERIIIVQAAKSEAPEQLARKVIQPNNATNLRMLEETIQQGPEGAVRWETFRASARGYFIDDSRVHNLNNTLNTYDSDTLGVLFNQAEIRDLRRIADRVEIIDAINMPAIAKRQSDATAMFQELVRSGKTRQIREFTDLVGSLDPGDAQRMDIRAGLIENIYNDVVTVGDAGVNIVDAAKLQNSLNDLRQTGAIKLLTADDIKILEDLETVVPWLPRPADLGASLEAASVAAAGRGVPRAIVTGDLGVVWQFTGEMMELFGLGRMFTSPTIQRLVLGAGKDKIKQLTSLRIFGAVAADVISTVGVAEPDDDNR